MVPQLLDLSRFRHSCRFIAVLDVKFLCSVTLCTLLTVVPLVVLLEVPMSLFSYSTCVHYLMYILFTLGFVQCLCCILQPIICRHAERPLLFVFTFEIFVASVNFESNITRVMGFCPQPLTKSLREIQCYGNFGLHKL